MQEFIPRDANPLRRQLVRELKTRGVSGGTIPLSLAARIDRSAYPGKKMDLDGISLWVKT